MAAPPSNFDGAVLHKIFLMDVGPDKFKVARQLLAARYKLFGNIITNNTEVATLLIDNRANPDCQAIGTHHIHLIEMIPEKERGFMARPGDADGSITGICDHVDHGDEHVLSKVWINPPIQLP